MADKYFYLTNTDRDKLSRVSDLVLGQTLNPPNPNLAEGLRSPATERFVVVPPCGEGIPARDGETPGYASCCLFALRQTTVDGPWLLTPAWDKENGEEPYRVDVYNIHDTAWAARRPPDEYYITATKDKYGKWLCDKPSVTDSTETTTTTTPVGAVPKECESPSCGCVMTWTEYSPGFGYWQEPVNPCSAATSTSTTNPDANCFCPRQTTSTTTTTTTTSGGSTTSTTTTTKCGCVYPTFCGTVNGQKAYTNCSTNRGKPPVCSTTSTTTTSGPTSSTTTTTTTSFDPSSCNCATTTTDPNNACLLECTWIKDVRVIPGSGCIAPTVVQVWSLLDNPCIAPCASCPSPGTDPSGCEPATAKTMCGTIPTTKPCTPVCGGFIGWTWQGSWRPVCGSCQWYCSEDLLGTNGGLPCTAEPPTDDGTLCAFVTTLCRSPETTTTTTLKDPCMEYCYGTTTTTTTSSTSTTTTTTDPCAKTCLYQKPSGGGDWTLIKNGCPPTCPCPPPQKVGCPDEVAETKCSASTTTSTTKICEVNTWCIYECKLGGSEGEFWPPAAPPTDNVRWFKDSSSECGSPYGSPSAGGCCCNTPYGGATICDTIADIGKKITVPCYSSSTNCQPPPTTSTTTTTTTTGCSGPCNLVCAYIGGGSPVWTSNPYPDFPRCTTNGGCGCVASHAEGSPCESLGSVITGTCGTTTTTTTSTTTSSTTTTTTTTAPTTSTTTTTTTTAATTTTTTTTTTSSSTTTTTSTTSSCSGSCTWQWSGSLWSRLSGNCNYQPPGSGQCGCPTPVGNGSFPGQTTTTNCSIQ